MDYERICCYSSADVQALQVRSNLFVDLVSLESVRVARETYALLGEMVGLRSCLCAKLDLLSLVAGVALELHKVGHDLFPRFLVQDAKLDGAVLEALLLLKHSAIALLHLAEAIKQTFEEEDDESFHDVISRPVLGLGVSLKDTADKVLKGGHKIVWLQARVTCLLGLINSLLATPVRFPPSTTYVSLPPPKEKMASESIRCYTSADVKALQQIRSNEVVIVDLVSLESAHVARESYAHLRELLGPRNWVCGDLNLLSLVAGVSLELHKIKHDLLPRFLVQEAKLDVGVVEALLVLKTSAIALLDLARAMKDEVDDVDDDVISHQVKLLGMSLKHTANQVLMWGANIDSLQARVRAVVGPIDALLATQVVFHS